MPDLAAAAIAGPRPPPGAPPGGAQPDAKSARSSQPTPNATKIAGALACPMAAWCSP